MAHEAIAVCVTDVLPNSEEEMYLFHIINTNLRENAGNVNKTGKMFFVMTSSMRLSSNRS